MCMGKTPKPIAPATPPPPPQVLEQQAPEVKVDGKGAAQARRAGGTKEYRNPLGIKNNNVTQAGNSGLSIRT